MSAAHVSSAHISGAHMCACIARVALLNYVPGTRICSLSSLRAVQASSHLKHASGFSQAGCYLCDSSTSSTPLFPPSNSRRSSNEPPFDRHDWIVRRPSTGEEVRYVIDYYSAPPLSDGSPVFSLDVRPALDSVGSIGMRIRAATEGIWKDAREEGRM